MRNIKIILLSLHCKKHNKDEDGNSEVDRAE